MAARRVCQTTTIEPNNYIGGHVLSRTVDINGESLAVDLGAQYFGPNNYPNFWQLIGDPDNASYPSKNVLGLTPRRRGFGHGCERHAP